MSLQLSWLFVKLFSKSELFNLFFYSLSNSYLVNWYLVIFQTPLLLTAANSDDNLDLLSDEEPEPEVEHIPRSRRLKNIPKTSSTEVPEQPLPPLPPIPNEPLVNIKKYFLSNCNQNMAVVEFVNILVFIHLILKISFSYFRC